MGDTVAEMTRDEFREMLETLIEQKLLEILGDPDQGLEIKEELRERLLRQKQNVAEGEAGEPLDEVARKHDLV